MAQTPALAFEDVTFCYDRKNPSISHLTLAIEQGSFTTLLGPSGCGKTTLLRLISGFLEPTEGHIRIDGKDQRGIEPESRGIGMVFQDYALFPHMTVQENILYGLKLQKKATRQKMQEMMEDTARNLDLTALLERYPHELSGGQQQRVALARALVLNPRILLMDEPLSSLDTKLRIKVREELKAIQRKYSITTIYVTHDQEEALYLSDQIAVLDKGRLLQKGTAKDLYFKPADTFIADFIGRANFLSTPEGQILVRPEWLAPCQKEDADLAGTIQTESFLGTTTRLQVLTLGKALLVDIPTLHSEGCAEGSEIFLKILRQWKLPR